MAKKLRVDESGSVFDNTDATASHSALFSTTYNYFYQNDSSTDGSGNLSAELAAMYDKINLDLANAKTADEPSVITPFVIAPQVDPQLVAPEQTPEETFAQIQAYVDQLNAKHIEHTQADLGKPDNAASLPPVELPPQAETQAPAPNEADQPSAHHVQLTAPAPEQAPAPEAAAPAPVAKVAAPVDMQLVAEDATQEQIDAQIAAFIQKSCRISTRSYSCHKR